MALTQRQIEALQEACEKIAEPISEWLLKDAAERIAEAAGMTRTADYELHRARALGKSQKDLEKFLKEQLKLTDQEIKELFEQAAEWSSRNDLERLDKGELTILTADMEQAIAGAIKLAQEDFTNLTQTIGMVSRTGQALPLQQFYRETMDFAFEQVFTGAADYETAIRQATAKMAEMGVRVIDYESGVHTGIEAATRRNMMGGMGLLDEQIAEENHDRLGCDGWEISAHGNSAPDHEPIQGLQFSDADYKRLNARLKRRIGTLNCGHVAFPIILGVNEPQYTPDQLRAMAEENAAGFTYQGRHYTGYEATQKQRQLERSMRVQKNRILVSEATGDAKRKQTAQIRLNMLQREYKNFSKSTGLRIQAERAHVSGFTYKHANAAAKVASRNALVTETIGRSVGAKAKNYEVFNPITQEITHLVEGTRITQPKNHIIAGAGRNRQIDLVDLLLDKYGGDGLKWTKEKGFGYVADQHGEGRYVELHWYQEPSVGKVEMKIKIQPDGRVYLDED